MFTLRQLSIFLSVSSLIFASSGITVSDARSLRKATTNDDNAVEFNMNFVPSPYDSSSSSPSAGLVNGSGSDGGSVGSSDGSGSVGDDSSWTRSRDGSFSHGSHGGSVSHDLPEISFPHYWASESGSGSDSTAFAHAVGNVARSLVAVSEGDDGAIVVGSQSEEYSASSGHHDESLDGSGSGSYDSYGSYRSSSGSSSTSTSTSGSGSGGFGEVSPHDVGYGFVRKITA